MKAFIITLRPFFHLYRCDKLKAEEEEEQGLFGFHKANCPDCVREFAGVEGWGENGHKQCQFPKMPTPEELPELEKRFSHYSTATKFVIAESGSTYVRS